VLKTAAPTVASYAGFDPGIQANSPNGAGFDSPGRQPWAISRRSEKPQRGEIPGGELGPIKKGISPRWGCRNSVDCVSPGLTRPGLSNLAPLGLTRDFVAEKSWNKTGLRFRSRLALTIAANSARQVPTGSRGQAAVRLNHERRKTEVPAT
jgi:hypothetical protein